LKNRYVKFNINKRQTRINFIQVYSDLPETADFEPYGSIHVLHLCQGKLNINSHDQADMTGLFRSTEFLSHLKVWLCERSLIQLTGIIRKLMIASGEALKTSEQ
jgi:hypothetical protein